MVCARSFRLVAAKTAMESSGTSWGITLILGDSTEEGSKESGLVGWEDGYRTPAKGAFVRNRIADRDDAEITGASHMGEKKEWV